MARRVRKRREKKTHLRINKLHDRLLQIIQIDSILRRRPRHHIILIIIVTSQLRKFLSIAELDIHPILLHDSLDTPPANSDDPFMVRLGHVERDLRGKFFLEESKTLENGGVVARDVDQEVVIVERFEFDFHVRRLHDLIDLPVLLATDELAVFVCELDLEAYLVVEGLWTEIDAVTSRQSVSA